MCELRTESNLSGHRWQLRHLRAPARTTDKDIISRRGSYDEDVGAAGFPPYLGRRLLKSVGYISDNRAAGIPHAHDVARVHDQVVVAELSATLAYHNVRVARLAQLVSGVGHHHRVTPLALLDVNHLARLRGGNLRPGRPVRQCK